MSKFLFKSISFGYSSTVIRTSNLGFVGDPNVFRLRLFSANSNRHSFTVSYLINRLGLSPQSALSVSKHVDFMTPVKADRVINLFKEHGFTQTQISDLVRRYPRILILDAEKNILPKLEFFEAKGISGPEMAKKLSVLPTVLGSSLAEQIIPSYDFLRSLFQSDEKVIIAVKRYPDILTHNIEKYMAPNIDILLEHRVPGSKIATLLINWPMSFNVSSDLFRKIVEKVEDMGFDASNVKFVLAVHAFRTTNESKWQSKVEAYKKWGLCEEDVLNAFRKYPWCMTLSEDKIMACMDFFINQMDLKPCFIAKDPRVLSWSLRKRLIPRFLVFQVLLTKGLVKKEISLMELFKVPDKKFLQKFVVPYKVEAPELLKLYKEKLNLPNGRPFVDKV